jgi:hypothetical protein
MSQKGSRHTGLPNCSICNEPVDLKTAKTDEDGKGVHEECNVDRMRRDPVTTLARMEMRCVMCRSCGSSNQTQFGSEIIIHFSGLKNLDKPAVMVFPKILICLDCGVTEFTVPKAELDQLGERGAASMAA